MYRRLMIASIALVTAAALGGCSARSGDVGLPTEWSTHGDDPVSVVEGYFAAWEHGNDDLRAGLVDTALVELAEEPPTSIERLDVFVTEGDAYQATCEATFELAQVVGKSEPGDRGTVERSKHTWVFALTFYEDRGSYTITHIERDKV